MAKCYFNVNQQHPAQNQAPIARTSRTWGGRGGHHHHRVKCCHTVSGCLAIALTLPRQWSSTGVNTPIPCGSLLIVHTQPCPRISQQANKASSLHSIASLTSVLVLAPQLPHGAPLLGAKWQTAPSRSHHYLLETCAILVYHYPKREHEGWVTIGFSLLVNGVMATMFLIGKPWNGQLVSPRTSIHVHILCTQRLSS